MSLSKTVKLDKLKEECAVFGVCVNDYEAAGITYNALLSLQHRGQEGAGIAVLKNSGILFHKNIGLVSEVFTQKVLKKLPKTHFAIGHNRYSTTGNNTIENTQPFVTEFLKGRIATAHNGNIVNAKSIRKKLKCFGCDFLASSDSEVISSLIAYEALNHEHIEDAVATAAKQIHGAFSLVVLSSQGKLVALRDASGFRPLCLGKNEHGYAVSSESCALDSSGFDFVRDIEPGELIVIDENGVQSHKNTLSNQIQGLCIFEYVYFARSDSIIDGLSVYEARIKMGEIIAKECSVDADIVCGVPDSGLEAAMGYSKASGLPLVSGFVKNRYIGRSFIYPTQSQRDAAVRLKLNPLKANIAGKRIVLVDDSIVRGTTSAKIIASLKNAGANEVHMRISSPPFRYACHFGTDIDSEDNLIANHMQLEDIKNKIDADSLGYISTEGLKQACKKSKIALCTGCFTGNYPINMENHTKSQFEED